MSDDFFSKPILNSPYDYPGRHWQLDKEGQPTSTIVEKRRNAEFITPIPKSKRRKQKQQDLGLGVQKDISDESQKYDPTPVINEVRKRVDVWRNIEDPNEWGVTPETRRLLEHWRHHRFSDIRPFFCQVEAVETAIWLTEVASKRLKDTQWILEHLDDANRGANPELDRLALKLATGAGKTTVMAMLIAWQTINAVRRPNSKKFTAGFLVICPGITIRDRLRVLLPNDNDSYFKTRELVPEDMLGDLQRAKIVITNYHSFKLRENQEIAKGNRALLQGQLDEEIKTIETEGQMLKRVMPELLGMKNIIVLNDEAHHCYREKPTGDNDEPKLKGDDRKEAEKNSEAARLWISGIEAVNRKLGVSRVLDLSATPFFLKGSGYVEGTLFPWVMSDFSLMDAIECGIVKLPRVPITDNLPKNEIPMYRNLWEHIRKDMPKKRRDRANPLDPEELPPQLQTALEALYGHYEKTYEEWQKAGISVPPCFIIVCNNTSASKLVYDYVSGYERKNNDGTSIPTFGRLKLFRNHDEHGNPLARPNTLLIDSEQLESGDALDKSFRDMASAEIEQFKNEIVARTGDQSRAENISDQELLREVMNTVGKKDRLGESIRCVVSVSMLTEGWDANTVTHVLGVRAFGTQLLCEQVIGRALRRQSYTLNDEGLFNAEYADVLGIPFDFNAKPVVAKPQAPKETVHITALPDRKKLKIEFPRVAGYRVELPEDRLSATFNEDSILELTPDLIGATETKNSGIIGEQVDLNLVHTGNVRQSEVLFHLTKRLVETKFRDKGEDPKLALFFQFKRIAKQWLDEYLVCRGRTYPAQLMYQTLADMACERITAAITVSHMDTTPIKAILDPFNPVGSSEHVSFYTTKQDLYTTSPERCHVNHVVCDGDWEMEFCRVAEDHPKVRSYVKNHNLGLEVPYQYGSVVRRYRPDFIVRVDDGRGDDDLLNLVVEIKGYRGEDAKDKANTMHSYWVPGVNHHEKFGRWAFAEFRDVFEMQDDFSEEVERRFGEMIEDALASATTEAHS